MSLGLAITLTRLHETVNDAQGLNAMTVLTTELALISSSLRPSTLKRGASDNKWSDPK